MKKIFILGASRLQIPAIKKAKEKGLYVYVLDINSEAEGISMADEFLQISTIDKENVYKAALFYKPDYIITSTSDMPVRTVSWVNEKLGNETDISYQGAVCATDKIAMLERMIENNIPIPQFYKIVSYNEFMDIVPQLDNLFVIKPVDNAASRGVILVDKNKKPNYKKLYDYCRSYSRCGIILAEEYMEGPEVSVESFSIDRKPYVITITDKIVTEKPFFVELGHTEPSCLPLEIQRDIEKITKEAIHAIGMINGPTHTEIKVTPTGVKLVEIAARLGGDFITSDLVPLSTGVNLIECSYAALLKEKVPIKKTIERGAAIRFIQGETGTLKFIDGIEKIKSMPGVNSIEIYKKIGDKIYKPKSSNDRIGHIITSGKNAREATEYAENALENLKIVIE